MHLYEIAQEYRDLLNAIDAGDVPEEAIADTLESLDAQLDDKLENVAVFIKELTADAEALAAEEAAIKARKQAKQRRAEALTNYLTTQMERTGRRKLETARAVISLRRSSFVDIDNTADFVAWAEEHGRDDLLTYKAPEISKTAVKAAIENGETIPHATISERGKAGIK